jgi:hypothetical protein
MALLVTSGGRATPFFQAHGQLDRVVPYLFGQLSAQLIGLFGVTVLTLRALQVQKRTNTDAGFFRVTVLTLLDLLVPKYEY